MLTLPVQRLRTEHRQPTGDLILKASSRSSQFTMAQVQAQLPRALKAEGPI
jgi:hypothetical protein